MKRANRTWLHISKKIREKIFDRFTVVVKTEEKDLVKKEYESQGYKVFEGTSYSKDYKG